MKSTLRREMLGKRNSITSEEVMEKSAVIQKRIIELPAYWKAKGVALYADFNNEVSTSFIFDDALRRRKKVLLPCIRKEEKELVFFPVKGRDELKAGSYCIMEPSYIEGGSECISRADLLLIPGVAYDENGGRLGYGGGYYDRCLGKLEKRPLIVAPAYEFQIVGDVPVNLHDIRVDMIVTEKRVMICSK